MYDCMTSEFDIEQHAKTYINYLEVVMSPTGKVEYAVPSHQEKLISICCNQLHISREVLSTLTPPDHYFDFIGWLCKLSGHISIWDNFYSGEILTIAQLDMLTKLKDAGLYKGKI